MSKRLKKIKKEFIQIKESKRFQRDSLIEETDTRIHLNTLGFYDRRRVE